MTPEEVNARIASHEAICAERYARIRDDLSDLKEKSREDIGDIKKLLWWLLSGMATGLFGTLAYLLVHFVVK